MSLANSFTARIERTVSPAAIWSRRLAFFSFVLLSTIALAHRLGLVEAPDLLPLLGVVLAVLAVALAGAFNAHRRYWYHADARGLDVFWAFFWCAATAAPLALLGYWYFAYPALTDISTDTDDPPVIVDVARTQAMNAVSRPSAANLMLQKAAYPLIAGKRYELGFDRVLPAVESLLERRGWPVTGSQDSVGVAVETTIEAEARSALLAMPSDIAIRIADEGTATFVDMRSASRYGARDLGDNAALIASFLADLDAEMTTRSSPIIPRAADAPELDAPTEGDLQTPQDGVPAPAPRPEN